MFERDSKEIVHARHNLLAEQVHLRLQQHTLHMQFQCAQAETASKEAVGWASSAISEEYPSESKSALEAQKYMHREDDAMHRDEVVLYKQAWEDAEQVQMLCNHELVTITKEKSELILHKPRF